jgi:predicted metal-dependent phosphoesterase TrpH
MWIVDSNEAGFRAASTQVCEEWADKLSAIRAAHGFANARINRAGCLENWTDQLRAEENWLRASKADLAEREHLAREQVEKERSQREAEQLRLAAEEEADAEKKKARFLGSFSRLKWL